MVLRSILPVRAGAAGGRLLLAAACLPCEAAAAAPPPAPLTAAPTQALPIIVTYEMKRQREAAVASVRDPKAFWVRQVMARLEATKPDALLGLKQPATALVMFMVDRSGRIASKAIVKTSGVPAADAQALAMLERAEPFPPMPSAVPGAVLSFSLPLRFR